MDDPSLILQVIFYQSENSKEPVREWLKSLSQDEKKLIGEAIKTVQFSYPIGMPLVRACRIKAEPLSGRPFSHFEHD